MLYIHNLRKEISGNYVHSGICKKILVKLFSSKTIVYLLYCMWIISELLLGRETNMSGYLHSFN